MSDYEIPNDDDVSPDDIQPEADLAGADLSEADLKLPTSPKSPMRP